MVAAYLRRGDVHVVRPGHVAAEGGAQEAVAVRQYFEHAVAVDDAVLGGAGLEQGEDEFLLAHGTGVLKLVLFRKIHEILHLSRLEFSEIEDAFFGNGSRGFHFRFDRSFALPYRHREPPICKGEEKDAADSGREGREAAAKRGKCRRQAIHMAEL
jgi:hypothetical protein